MYNKVKIFFSAVSSRLCTFFTKNNFLDTSVKKEGVPGMSGCLEHTGVVSQLFREASENKGNLFVSWLDLANAVGSTPHKPVELTLAKRKKKHVPSRVKTLIADYYTSLKLV